MVPGQQLTIGQLYRLTDGHFKPHLSDCLTHDPAYSAAVQAISSVILLAEWEAFAEEKSGIVIAQ